MAIRYSRGHIGILDRPGLEALARPGFEFQPVFWPALISAANMTSQRVKGGKRLSQAARAGQRNKTENRSDHYGADA